MGSWANQGRKTFKKGKMDDDYNVYRQSYFNANLPSLKKFLVYLANDSGETYRYLFLQYVFTEGETAVHIQSHGNVTASEVPVIRSISRRCLVLWKQFEKERGYHVK